MSAFRSLLLCLMVVGSSFGEKQNENNEIHRAIEKIDQLDNSFNELKQIIIDSSLYAASRDAEAALTRRNQGDTAGPRTRRENDDLHVANVFVTLYNKTAQTWSDVKVLLNDVIPAMMADIQSIKEETQKRAKSCLEHLWNGHTESGVYKIYTAKYAEATEVFCDQETDGGGWLVFQRRQDGLEDFYRSWSEYETGFGDLEGEFWLGNDNLHRLTFGNRQELRIDLGDFDNKKAFAKYAKFMIGSKSTKYVLMAEGYTGDAGDSLSYSNGQQFSTKDRDNDKRSSSSCSQEYKGGWWYYSCTSSNLNGLYSTDKQSRDVKNVCWWDWKHGRYPLKFTEMKFRLHDRN